MHTVEKAVTLLQTKRPSEPERLPVPGTSSGTAQLVYEHTRPIARDVNTLLGYVSALRLICGTYAYCGSHVVDSKVSPGTPVIFFDYGTVLAYADDAMHKTLEIAIPEGAKLRWLRARARAHEASWRN